MLPRLLASAGAALLAGVQLPAAETAAARPLDAIVLPTVQYAHNEIWFHTPSDIPPSIAITSEIAPEQRLDLVVLGAGGASDDDGRVHLTYHFEIVGPDGKVLHSPESVVIHDVPSAPHALHYPREVTSFRTSPGEPTGEYRFTCTLTDRVSEKTVEKTITVRVASSNDPLPLPSDVNFDRFLGTYHARPHPRLALPALIAFSRTPFATRPPNHHGVLLGFYERVLADNPWLVPQFKKHFAAASQPAERRLFARVLAFSHASDEPFADLPRKARDAITLARREGLPTPTPRPQLGGPLDVHWGRFLASGRFTPIADLVAVAEAYAPAAAKIPLDEKGRPKNPDAPANEIREAIIFRTAVWSLGSNTHQHELVRTYLSGIARSEKASPLAREIAQRALASKPPSPH